VTIDPAARTVVAAHVIPGLARPAGIAIKGNELYVVSETGAVTMAERPGGPPD
jgi:hypothetical protein